MKENNTRIQFDDTVRRQGSPITGRSGRTPPVVAPISGRGSGPFRQFETGTIVLAVDAGAPANAPAVAHGQDRSTDATPVPDPHREVHPAHRLEQTSGRLSAQTWILPATRPTFSSGMSLGFAPVVPDRPGAPTSSIDISATGHVGSDGESGCKGIDAVVLLYQFWELPADLFGVV